MAQETGGLRIDDGRDERSPLDRDEEVNTLATATTTEVDADTGIGTRASSDDEDVDLSLTTEDTPNAETDQLREQIEETRASMGQTIDAIQERLSISNISEQVSEQVSSAIETAKDTVYDATVGKVVNFMKQTGSSISTTSIGRTISANPIPFALIGAGTAWLIYSSMTDDKRRYGNGRYYNSRNRFASQGQQGNLPADERNTGSTATGAISAASGAIGTATDKISNTASQAYDSVASTASDTYNKASDAVNRAYTKVGDLGHTAQEKYEHYVEEKPLAVAAAAAAVGAVIGFAIPSTRYEGELVGETRDQLVNKASGAATQLVDKAKEVAGEAGKAIKEEISTVTETTGSTGKGATGTGTTGRTSGGRNTPGGSAF